MGRPRQRWQRSPKPVTFRLPSRAPAAPAPLPEPLQIQEAAQSPSCEPGAGQGAHLQVACPTCPTLLSHPIAFKPPNLTPAPPACLQMMRVDLLPLGRQQPFYHVLVDERFRPNAQMTYVAQASKRPSTVAAYFE